MAPLDQPPFAWPSTPEEVKASTKQVLDAAAAMLDAVAAVPDDELSFEKVVRPLMLAPNYKTNPLVCQSKFLQHCSTDEKVREAAEEAGQQFAAVKAKAKTRSDVFAKVEAFSKTPAAAELSPYEAHFLDAVLADFRRGGLALDEEGKKELQRLLDADAACCSKYGSNLAGDKTRLRFSVKEMEGLPESFVKEHTDKETGEVVISLKPPDITPVMGQCHVAETRRKVSTAREMAYENNLDLVAEGIGYRKEIAKLLGYPSWAHFVTERRMSGSPETVVDFMAKIRELAKDGAAKDLETLRQCKLEHLKERGELTVPEGDVKIEAHDSSFYHNRILKNKYGVDEEAIRNYFPLDHVMATTLDIYQELLSLTFTEIPKGEFVSWHESLRLFLVSDGCVKPGEPLGKRVGHFYVDLHPRDGKYSHAAIFHLLKGNGEQTPVDCMLANLPPPSADGKPALLRHDDVVTFFHEFGHIMHALCSEGDGNSTRLAKCPRDFVEAPSQMLENWCWQPLVLRRLSKHHETGEKLPEELISSLIAAKAVHESVFLLRQIYLSTLDLTIHNEAPPKSVEELQELVDRLRPEITGIANPPGANMLRSFGHLMNQYSAAYYGYMWAEVISADMFATRFEADCMNKEAGMAYRKQVLAPGGTGKIMEHLSKFLGGRPPQQAPFLKSRGILKE